MNPLSENKTLSATSLNGAIGACRLNIDAVDELMQLLEGCDWRTYIKMNLPDGKQVHLDGDQITVLRKAYFITLLQQYGPSDEDRDLLLAAAGLLAGYESIDSTETDKSSKITPRLTKYKEETQYAKSIGTLSKNERNKLDKFSNALYTKRQTGTINLWNDVLHYLGVEGIAAGSCFQPRTRTGRKYRHGVRTRTRADRKHRHGVRDRTRNRTGGNCQR